MSVIRHMDGESRELVYDEASGDWLGEDGYRYVRKDRMARLAFKALAVGFIGALGLTGLAYWLVVA